MRMTSRGAGARRNWGVLLVLLTIAALFVAYTAWWYQADGQGVLESFAPDGANVLPVDWEQERLRSQVRMLIAVVVAVSAGVGGVLLLKRRKKEEVGGS